MKKSLIALLVTLSITPAWTCFGLTPGQTTASPTKSPTSTKPASKWYRNVTGDEGDWINEQGEIVDDQLQKHLSALFPNYQPNTWVTMDEQALAKVQIAPASPAASEAASASAPATLADTPKVGEVDTLMASLNSSVFDDALIREITATVAEQMHLSVVVNKNQVVWNDPELGVIDITPGVVALAKLEKAEGATVSDFNATAGPVVIDPQQITFLALTQGKFARGNVIGYDGQSYRLKVGDKVETIDKKDVLSYGIIQEPPAAAARQTSFDTDTSIEDGSGVADGSGAKDVYVHGYFRKDGTYVHSYWRSSPGYGSHYRSRSGRGHR